MNHNRHTERLAAGGLFIAALLWGVSYPATKIVETYPTFYILPLRFLIASLILAVLFRKHFKNLNFRTLKQAFLLSFFITGMYVFSTVGIKYTISARASFFTCLTFVIVPVLNLVLFRIRVSAVIVRSILICFFGVLLLSYAPGSVGLSLNYGDILCIIASLAGSLHIVFLGRISSEENYDPMLFTALLMMFTALWTTGAGVVTGSFSKISITPLHQGTIIFLGVFCSAAAFLLQSVCQKYVPANRAGVIFALEPASGCVISVLLLNESMGTAGWIGAFLILLSSVYMETAVNRSSRK